MLGIAAVGCTPNYPETAHVSGKLTLNHQPLAGGEVQFLSDRGQVATGQVEADGSYRLTTFLPDDGAVPGKHRVIVRPVESFRSYGGSALITIPKRYTDPATSGLSAQVNPGINRIDFELEVTENDTVDEMAGRDSSGL
jgi:hypothetical protein